MKHKLIFTLIAVFAAAAVVMSLAPAPDGGLPKKEKPSGNFGKGGNSGQQRPGGNSSSGSRGGGSSHPTPPPAPAEIPEIEMIYVAGGTFNMGADDSDAYDREKPVHSVTVSGFSIGKYEVTQRLWKAVMGTNPSYNKGDNLPVENVSWNQVQEFIRKLNAMTGKHYRLPTEAEWEFAARGGNRSQGYIYSGSSNLSSVAWYYDNSGRKTHPVGTKAPNELGIYDMSGNVWEWTSDIWCTDYKSPRTGSYRVFRGGGWFIIARYCRVSDRGSNAPDYCDYDLGFRLAQ